jgi:adenylosuccinate synthase
MHKAHMVIDLQFGSTGKGLIAGYLAKREKYDTVVCSFATNAGHTYIDKSRDLHVMTQQLPTGITASSVRNVLIGPGALIHVDTLLAEMERYSKVLEGKRIFIHPHAAIVTSQHARDELANGMSRIGSTTKGVGAAMIQRILRNPSDLNVAATCPALVGRGLVATAGEYRAALEDSDQILIEGAQGFSLSMYHGFYPYTTSRDVSPWQIAADCGIPFKWASYIQVIGTMRTFPIRVNNRDGTSGPGYDDQPELTWDEVGQEAELTTVTKLPRRVFKFSDMQTQIASWHCGGYWDTKIFLNFANYVKDDADLLGIIKRIETPSEMVGNPPRVAWLGFGPDDADVMLQGEFLAWGRDGHESSGG